MTENTILPTSTGFVDRRSGDRNAPGPERRQFSASYEELSPEAKELGEAIDQYKLQHRRRFINYEELVSVLNSIGYTK